MRKSKYVEGKRNRIVLLLSALILSLCLAASGVVFAYNYVDYKVVKSPGSGQFDFDGNYTPPELVIDGKADDTVWGTTPELTKFGKENAVSAKVYRGEKAMFFFFEVKDTLLLTLGETNDDKVTDSDSVEVYLDTKGDGGTKPQSDDYQINLAIHGKTRIMQGSGSGWGGWNGLIDYEILLNGTLNDDTADVGYSVELMIPYAQIGIEKKDDVAISFGQVDKHKEGEATEDRTWNGWTFGGKLREPQIPNNYVILTGDNVLVDRAELPKPNANIAGYVKDSITNQPIVGVSVALQGVSGSMLTDSQGYYLFSNKPSTASYIVTFAKLGYYDLDVEYTVAEMRAANGGDVVKNIKFVNKLDADKSTFVGKTKNVINGYLEGVTVRVEGTNISSLSISGGSFSLVDVPVTEDIVLIASKTGYQDTKTIISKSDATVDGTTDIMDININLPYNAEILTVGGARGINMFSISISRDLNGMVFRFLTETKFDAGERLEVFLHTGLNSAKGYAMYLYGDGRKLTCKDKPNVCDVNFDVTPVTYVITKNDANEGSVLDVRVPYSSLNMTPSDVMGMSFGSWNEDWDGFGFDGFVDPALRETYARIDMFNKAYRANSNIQQVTVNGNVGVAGVSVTIDGKTATSKTDGSYSIKLDKPTTDTAVTYKKTGYTTTTQTVLTSDFNNSLSKTLDTIVLLEKKVTISGNIIDDLGAAVEGATVSIDGTEFTTTTNANGEYTFTNVGTKVEVKIVASKDGFASSFTIISLSDLNNDSFTSFIDKDVTIVDTSKVMDITGTLLDLNGAVKNATITVEGTSLSAVSGIDGTFTITGAPLVNGKLTIAKEGYETVDIVISVDGINQGDTLALGNIEMCLISASMGAIATKNETFGNFNGYVTRGVDGFNFKFISTKAFTGRIELFIDTKESHEVDGRNSTDYLFNLSQDGSFTIVNWAEGGNETKPNNMTLTVGTEGIISTVKFHLPYAFFGQTDAARGITATDVIGMSVGQWNGSDWDGWQFKNGDSYNGEYFVKPETTKDYIRFDQYNNLYWLEGNYEFTVSEDYNIKFGTDVEGISAKADKFFAKASRDENNIIFDFKSFGMFGLNGERKEFVMLYLDLPELGTGSGGWTYGENDMTVKIYSDGKVYYKLGTSPWWKTTTESLAMSDVLVTKTEGVTSFKVNLPYATLGITAQDDIGFAVREAADNDSDFNLYDPWFDCFVNGKQIDAANQKEFAILKSDGTVVK